MKVLKRKRRVPSASGVQTAPRAWLAGTTDSVLALVHERVTELACAVQDGPAKNATHVQTASTAPNA